MTLIGLVFTRLGGISRLAFVYRLPDGSIKTIPAGIGRKNERKTLRLTRLGRKMYPTLFHSAKQAVAYFAEVALKEENDG